MGEFTAAFMNLSQHVAVSTAAHARIFISADAGLDDLSRPEVHDASVREQAPDTPLLHDSSVGEGHGVGVKDEDGLSLAEVLG